MSEENLQNLPSQISEEQEIDLIELTQKMWAGRKLVFKACGVAALGLVVASVFIENIIDTTLYVYMKDCQHAPWWGGDVCSFQGLGMDYVLVSGKTGRRC